MKNTVVLLMLITLLGCREDDLSENKFDECVNGVILSTSACTGNGVIISVASDNRKLNKALDKYGDRREITVFDTDLSGVEVGDRVSFRILDLVDTARVCLMLWESPRGPEATIELHCE